MRADVAIGLAILVPMLVVGLLANILALIRYFPRLKFQPENFVWRILVAISSKQFSNIFLM